MRKKLKRGLFITFEGVEGAGKTTQVKLLRDFLVKKGYKVVLTREPGGTKLGEKIRKILASIDNKGMSPLAEFFLFSASRVQHASEVILPALKKGYIVICDRFADASVAYQGYGRGINLKVINNINKLAACSINPDLTFFLDLNPKKGLNRITTRSYDRFEIENKKFFDKVRKGYLALAKKEPKRIKVLKADLPVKILQEKIVEGLGSDLEIRLNKLK